MVRPRGHRPDPEVTGPTPRSPAAADDGIALFPDTVSTLGTRHLRELIGTLGHGGHVPLRAVLCFCVQRCDVREVRPADDIDPDYGRTLREALEAGVEAIAYRAELSPEAVVIAERIPVVCS